MASTQILAVGAFSRVIADHLEYHPSFYRGVPEGTTVVSVVFSVPTRRQTENLAEALGIGLHDVARYANLPITDSVIGNIEHAVIMEELDVGQDDIAALKALRAAGFSFHFRPEI